MKRFDIPGAKALDICHILLDYNGTLARDGAPFPGLIDRINRLAGQFQFHVITADTFGSVKAALKTADCRIVTIPAQDQARAKARYLAEIGAETTLACGNGVNDEAMLREAALGVAVLQEEGLAVPTLMAADILIRDIFDLFGFLEHPGRLIACLRR